MDILSVRQNIHRAVTMPNEGICTPMVGKELNSHQNLNQEDRFAIPFWQFRMLGYIHGFQPVSYCELIALCHCTIISSLYMGWMQDICASTNPTFLQIAAKAVFLLHMQMCQWFTDVEVYTAV